HFSLKRFFKSALDNSWMLMLLIFASSSRRIDSPFTV
ncbi:hypothetical protein NT04LM_1213a, partial [Listeria monocytogenes FSL F2-208]